MTKMLPRWLKVFPGSFRIQESQETQAWSWDREVPPWSKKWQPTQFSCLENSIGRAAWQGTVHSVVEDSDTTRWLSTHTEPFLFFIIMYSTTFIVLFKKVFKFFYTQWNTLACRKWETFKMKQLTQTWEWLGD